MDQCKPCTLYGDLAGCKVTPCGHHENWYAKELQAEIERLRAEIAAYREREDRGTEAWAVFDGDGKAQASTIKKYAHSVRLSAYLKEKKGYSVRRVRITEVTDEANQ